MLAGKPSKEREATSPVHCFNVIVTSWANGDAGELKADKEVILANPQRFKLGLIGINR